MLCYIQKDRSFCFDGGVTVVTAFVTPLKLGPVGTGNCGRVVWTLTRIQDRTSVDPSSGRTVSNLQCTYGNQAASPPRLNWQTRYQVASISCLIAERRKPQLVRSKTICRIRKYICQIPEYKPGPQSLPLLTWGGLSNITRCRYWNHWWISTSKIKVKNDIRGTFYSQE